LSVHDAIVGSFTDISTIIFFFHDFAPSNLFFSQVILIQGEPFVDLEWYLLVPKGFVEADIPRVGSSVGSRPSDIFTTNSGAPPASPIKGLWKSESRPGVSIAVISQAASTIKPTFTQLTDISQWGDLDEVAKTVLPKRSRVVGEKKIVLDRGVVDTGTVRGVVDLPPRNMYRYDFIASNGQRVNMAVGAARGNLYFLNVLGDEATWADKRARRILKGVADNFRILDKPIV